MTMPLMRPKRKNPILRTRQMNLPPGLAPVKMSYSQTS